MASDWSLRSTSLAVVSVSCVLLAMGCHDDYPPLAQTQLDAGLVDVPPWLGDVDGLEDGMPADLCQFVTDGVCADVCACEITGMLCPISQDDGTVGFESHEVCVEIATSLSECRGNADPRIEECMAALASAECEYESPSIGLQLPDACFFLFGGHTPYFIN